ncbi:MAG: RagB/SusD family nutrient uptake outer membrane protein [Prolixibacteraceae bacterium]|jgi:phage pi2 protein 07|nr:RagB/SusD family nutrient uptake outer membrane protein [Prolixibacteraceae bacterium]
MKKTIHILIFAVISLFWAACEDNINDMPQDYLDVNDLLTDTTYVIGFVDDIYGSVPNGYNRLKGNSMIASSSDEAVESGINSEAENMALGIWSAANTHDDVWYAMYEGIRKTNVFLEEIHPSVPDGLFRSANTVNLLRGQAYFFRALFHFELVKRYGGVPIVTEVLKAGEGADLSRDNYDNCIAFIVDQCDQAAGILPVEWPSATVNFGRVTKGAALALKARALLYAASPLFNDPSKTENSPEHGAYNAAKWQTAAQAANEVIALGYYNLFANYQNFFTTLNNNKEIIFLRMAAQNNEVEKLNGPSGYTGGGGGSCPTLDLVESFRMSDGSSFDWNNPAHAANPFANREPRFYATVLYNGATWMGDVIDTYEGGNDLGSSNSTKTGFYLKKFMSESARWFGGSTGNTYHCFPLFRYAETLLNFAEAMNEANGPSNAGSFSMNAVTALNMVRSRGGIPAVDTGVSKDELRELIRYERRIELAFEEHRHLDLRRWKIAQSILNQPVKGLKIVAENGGYSYQPKVAQVRVFRPEMYLYPLPKTEINRSNSLLQNSGW